jgi:RNA polymerase sigma factor (sigma-70 family)
MHAPLTSLAAHLAPPQPDCDLLVRFVRDRDEVAFAALVHRHGPTVYGVCRRILGNSADADDAFQAVFIVLVNRAAVLTHRPTLAGWLHEVTVRVAKKARTTFARLRKHEQRAAGARAEAVLDPAPNDAPAWLDRELLALPERFREPVVRCLIQERPRSEVAAELGIPEGTLASRLDAARKRLAERLARHRVPLVFVGLLVPVPAALQAATLRRATDGAGAALHQLAHEVTKMMFSNTKWAGLIAVGVLAVVGGLLLTAGVGDPPAARLNPVASGTKEPKESPESGQAKAPDKAKEPPEPEWMKAFSKVYQLADDQYVKRVAPPYIDERIDFNLHWVYRGKKVDAKVLEENRKRANEDSMFCMFFIEQDGKKLSYRTSLWWVGLKNAPEMQQGDNLRTVWEAIGDVTGLQEPEVTLEEKSKDDPLFTIKEPPFANRTKPRTVPYTGKLTVHGDFVTRKDAPLEKLVPQLEKILREECKLDVRLTLKEEEQPVFVVGGTFKPNPPEWRPKKELDIYATEEGLNKEYDHFDQNRSSETPKFATVKSSLTGGTPTKLVRYVGSRLGTRMVWDTPLPTEPHISWYYHRFFNPSKQQEADDIDPDKVLKVVSEQTGLTFKKETRKVVVLYVSAGKR